MMESTKLISSLSVATLICTVIATSANSKDPNALLQGTYASNSLWSCISTSADLFGTSFDANLAIQPLGSDSNPNWQALSTTVTYNGDGTGSEVGTAVNVNNQGALTLEINCDLQYVVDSDQSFEVTKQCNNILPGDLPVSTVVIENGHIGLGASVLITTTEVPTVETFDFPTLGIQTQAICARSGTQVLINKK